MVLAWIVVVVCTLVGSSESAFVDSLSKCAIKDNDCQKNLLQKIILEYSSTGVPEYEVPPLDPIKIKNVTWSLLGLLNITIKYAEGLGIKDCIIDSLSSEIEKGHTKAEITCDIILKGKFLVRGINSIADHLLQGNIHGDGNGEVKVEKLHMELTFFYNLVKKDDGEIYVSLFINQTEFSYDMQNFHVTADNIFLGEEEVSDKFVSYLNKNWKVVSKTFGKTVFEVILNHLHRMLNKILESTSATKVISDDLTPYVKH